MLATTRKRRQNFEGKLMFLEAWLVTICLYELCLEVVAMNLEDKLDGENINKIYRY